MISLDKKYQTRNGYPVELITTKARGDWPVVGYIGDSEDLIGWSLDGTNNNYSRLNVFDLVEVIPKHVIWLNVYSDDEVNAHESREVADKCAIACRIACLKVEFEEGQFDE